ncbi:MAG: D,D-dipeptide ABC transporter permease, partial [Thermus sp.]|nr:D,D-dipeptide ABC transporter permease [Thermus sp.]
MPKLWRRFLRNPGAVLGLLLLLGLVLLALLGPLFARDPLEQNLLQRLKPPSPEYPLGTDQLGRDVWARVVHGARISLGVGFGVVLLASLLGTAVGLLAGGLGGRWDSL